MPPPVHSVASIRDSGTETNSTSATTPRTSTPTSSRPPTSKSSKANGSHSSSNCATKVFVRVRPFTQREKLLSEGVAEDDSSNTTTKALPQCTVRTNKDSPSLITILDINKNSTPKASYNFERCFNSAQGTEALDGSGAATLSKDALRQSSEDQALIYAKVGQPVLLNALDGYNGCVFAYGQTGSGKTYTMMGPPEWMSITVDGKKTPGVSGKSTGKGTAVTTTGEGLEGIIPRLCQQLFTSLMKKRETEKSHSFRVEMEYFEIYNEKVMDLLNPAGTHLMVRNSANGPYVENLARKHVEEEREIFNWLRRGNEERHTASTKMNDRSSRSHAIVTLHVIQMSITDDGIATRMTSKLNLVDLAGSERVGASGVEGKHLKEAIKINLSLTTLGRVIDALADMSQGKHGVFCPFRDSNLTWLLMDSLGGNSRTTMIATISPHPCNFEESCHTLRYASRAKQIVTKAIVNEDPQTRQIKLLTAEVERLQRLLNGETGNEEEDAYVEELKERLASVESELQDTKTELERVYGELDALRKTRRRAAAETSTGISSTTAAAAGSSTPYATSPTMSSSSLLGVNQKDIIAKLKQDVQRLEEENLLLITTSDELHATREKLQQTEKKLTSTTLVMRRAESELKVQQQATKRAEKESKEMISLRAKFADMQAEMKASEEREVALIQKLQEVSTAEAASKAALAAAAGAKADAGMVTLSEMSLQTIKNSTLVASADGSKKSKGQTQHLSAVVNAWIQAAASQANGFPSSCSSPAIQSTAGTARARGAPAAGAAKTPVNARGGAFPAANDNDVKATAARHKREIDKLHADMKRISELSEKKHAEELRAAKEEIAALKKAVKETRESHKEVSANLSQVRTELSKHVSQESTSKEAAEHEKQGAIEVAVANETKRQRKLQVEMIDRLFQIQNEKDALAGKYIKHTEALRGLLHDSLMRSTDTFTKASLESENRHVISATATAAAESQAKAKAERQKELEALAASHAAQLTAATAASAAEKERAKAFEKAVENARAELKATREALEATEEVHAKLRAETQKQHADALTAARDAHHKEVQHLKREQAKKDAALERKLQENEEALATAQVAHDAQVAKHEDDVLAVAAEAKEREQRLIKERDGLSQQHKSAAEETAALVAAVQEKSTETATLSHNLREAKEELEAAKSEVASTACELQTLQSVREELVKKVKELESCISEAQAAAEERQRAMRELESNHGEMIENLNAAHAEELATLRGEHGEELLCLKAETEEKQRNHDSDLVNKNEELERIRADHASQVEHLESVASTTNAEFLALQEQLASIREEAAENHRALQAEAAALTGTIATKEKEVEKLTKQLHISKNVVESTHSDSVVQGEQLKASQASCSALTQQLEEVKSIREKERSEALERQAEAEKQVHERQIALDAYAQQCAALESAKRELEVAIAQVQKDLEQHKKHAAAREAELEQQKRSLEEAKDRLETQLQEVNIQLVEARAELAKTGEALESQKEEARAAQAAHKEVMAKQQEVMAQLTTQLEQQTQDHSALKELHTAQLEQANSDIGEAHTRCTSLREELEEARSVITGLEARVAEDAKEHSTIVKELEEATKAYEAHVETLKIKLTEQQTSHETDMAAAEKKHQTHAAVAATALEAAQSKHKVVQDTLNSTTKKLAEEKIRCDTLAKDKAALEKECAKVTQQTDTLAKKLESTKSDLDQTQEERNSLQGQLDTTTATLTGTRDALLSAQSAHAAYESTQAKSERALRATIFDLENALAKSEETQKQADAEALDKQLSDMNEFDAQVKSMKEEEDQLRTRLRHYLAELQKKDEEIARLKGDLEFQANLYQCESEVNASANGISTAHSIGAGGSLAGPLQQGQKEDDSGQATTRATGFGRILTSMFGRRNSAVPDALSASFGPSHGKRKVSTAGKGLPASRNASFGSASGISSRPFDFYGGGLTADDNDKATTDMGLPPTRVVARATTTPAVAPSKTFQRSAAPIAPRADRGPYVVEEEVAVNVTPAESRSLTAGDSRENTTRVELFPLHQVDSNTLGGKSSSSRRSSNA